MTIQKRLRDELREPLDFSYGDVDDLYDYFHAQIELTSLLQLKSTIDDPLQELIALHIFGSHIESIKETL